MSLQGRKALVTGAAGGIGTAIVQRLRDQGAEVVGTDRTGADLDGDLMDPAFCDALPGMAAERMGGLDILVNNAGVITRGRITEASDQDLARSLAVNVEAPFRTCRAAIPLMERGGGAIVNIASCWGVHPGPDHPLYCMTKAAVASLTQCLGRDHARAGIRVNAVCPNEVNTPMIRTGFEIRGLEADQAVAALNASVPLGRIAEPEDIADVVLFLVSDQARYMCGSLVEVNGGKPVG
ncbi:MAG: SDR family oxidoreductase [Pseudomonadota bacterium]